jgi:DNA-binding SARP family transcriptional activator
MGLETVLNDIMAVFEREAAHAKIVLLHPGSRYRSVFVAHLINDPSLNVLYYAFGPDDINLDSFLAGLMNQVSEQYPLFGRHVMALRPQENTVDKLTHAFAADLAEVSAEPYYLVLDEYDRGDAADDIQLFFDRLVDHLPPQCHIVINSRTLPRLPWISMIAKRAAVILHDDAVVREHFYGPVSGTGDHLQVFALGPGFVLLNDQPIDTWEGHLPRLLFFFVLDRAVITRSEICQAFWPELDNDQAVNVFHVTKRRLHKALGMDVLVHDNRYYHINPKLNIEYDVTEFVSQLMHGRDESSPNQRTAAWQRAIDMYRGPFLQSHQDSWIASRRRDFCIGYLEALYHMAQTRLSENRPEHALNLLLRAVQEDATREDLHQQIIQLYHRLGRRSEAASHYHRMMDEAERHHRRISDTTRRIYQDIMA